MTAYAIYIYISSINRILNGKINSFCYEGKPSCRTKLASVRLEPKNTKGYCVIRCNVCKGI